MPHTTKFAMEAREKIKHLRAHPIFHSGTKRPKIDKEVTVPRTISITTDRHSRKHGELLMPKIDRGRDVAPTKSIAGARKRKMNRPVRNHGRFFSRFEAYEAKAAARKSFKIENETATAGTAAVEASTKRESHMDRLRRKHGFLLKSPPKSDNETPTASIKREAKASSTKNCIDIIDDDDDDFSITDLDNPDVVSPWKPKIQTFRWKVGDTVEVAPPGEISEDTLTDFCTIVGTNQDGTYNLQDIISKTYKKSVPQSRILGNYEDLVNAKEEEKEDKKPKAKPQSAKIKNSIDGNASKSNIDYMSEGDSNYDSDDYVYYGENCALV